MGIRCLLAQKNTDVSINELSSRLESLGATKKGKWSLVTYFYHLGAQKDRNAENVFAITMDEKPDSCWWIMKNIIVEAEGSSRVLFLRLDLLTPRQILSIRGWEYQLGDFVIRIGQLILKESIKGISIDIEYKPCLHTACGAGILKEIFAMVVPSTASSTQNPNLDKAGPSQQAPGTTPQTLINGFGLIFPPSDPSTLVLPSTQPPTLYSYYHLCWQYLSLFRSLKLI